MHKLFSAYNKRSKRKSRGISQSDCKTPLSKIKKVLQVALGVRDCLPIITPWSLKLRVASVGTGLHRLASVCYKLFIIELSIKKRKKKHCAKKEEITDQKTLTAPFFLQLNSQASMNKILFNVACEIAFNFLCIYCVLTNVLLLTCFYVQCCFEISFS